MSHVVNPILFRLKYSSFWSSVCVSNKKFLFFLDSKNISILEYLSKIVKRMYFLYKKYNITYFKLIYKSKSINIYFMLKQMKGFSFKSRGLLKIESKIEIKKVSFILFFDAFKQFKNDPIKSKSFEMRHYASNWFEFFNNDLYYDVNIKSRLKTPVERFRRINIRLKRNIDIIVPYATSAREKKKKDEFLRLSLLSEKVSYTLKRFYSIRRYEKIYKKENLREQCLTSLFSFFLPKFYNSFVFTLNKNFNTGSDIYDYKKFLENLVLNKVSKTQGFEINYKKRQEKSVRKFKKIQIRCNKLSHLFYSKKYSVEKKKIIKKKNFHDWSNQFVLSSTDNLSFLLNKLRRVKYTMLIYGKEKLSTLNNFLKKSKKALDLKNIDDNFKQSDFDILNAKESEIKEYKIWRLSNHYLDDIETMYKDLKGLTNKNNRRHSLLLKSKLKKSNLKKIVFRRRNISFRVKKGNEKLFYFPIMKKIAYEFKRQGYFRFKRKKYFKFKKRGKYRKTVYYFKNKNYKSLKYGAINRFNSAYELIFKSYNRDWFYFYDEIFLYQRKKWEKEYKMGFKFYNTFEYKLPLQYLTFPYMDYYYIWIPLFNQFLYERQRRLFPSTSILSWIRKREDKQNEKLHKKWEYKKKYNLATVKYNKKYLYYLNFKGFLSQKYKSRRYWKRNKTLYKYLKKRKKFRKLVKRVHYSIKFKKHKIFKKYIYWLKQVQFLSIHSIYIFILKNKISCDLNLIFSFKINFNIYFFIKKPGKTTRVNAITIFNYIKRRIFRGALLFKLLKRVMRKFKKFYYLRLIDGFAIKFSGRFSKRDRAAHYWFKHGKFTKSTRISKIDHYYGKMFLKYSTCSLKVSIMRNNYRHRLKKKKEKLKKIKKIRNLRVIQ